MMYLGIEIGGTKLQLVAGNGDGTIERQVALPVERSAGAEGIRAQIVAALPALVQEYQPAAIGVGFGGPVDWETGRICCSHQISGWGEFPLGSWLSSTAGIPAFVENDANVAALGEALHGAGRGFNTVFWINMGSGVGGGLVTQGSLYHGAKPGEAEIGHVRLDKSGTLVEQKCSGWAVDLRIREAVQLQPTGILANLVSSNPGAESRQLGPALAQNDPIAQAILSELADNLGFALSHVVQLFHPEVIVIGGGLALVGEPLRAAISEALPRYVMNSFLPGPKVRIAGLLPNSVPVGALALAASRLDAKGQ
jgi:glucokinase